MTSELEKNGHELFAKLIGEKDALAIHENLKKYDPDFAKFLNEQLFGSIWTRPGLEITIRSFITMASLIALGRFNQLRLHMKAALNLGITELQLKEMIFHLSQYCGVPAAVEATIAFREATEEKK
jgi:4-carboxymuconolactone decarboxylase